jgi:copper transport protein
VVVGWAGSAAAHASLVATEPAAGSLVDESPDQVVVRFNEAVGIPPQALRLFDSQGKAVRIGEATHGDEGSDAIAASVPSLAGGLYVVAWHAISADTHPVTGAFTFQVGTGPTGADAGTLIPKVLAENPRDGLVGWLAGVSRFIRITAVVALIGALCFPSLTGASSDDRRWRAWCAIAAVTAALAAWAALVFEAAASAEGALGTVLHGDVWSALLQTTAGKASLAGAVFLTGAAVALLAAVNGSGLPAGAAVFTAAATLAEAASGHGATGDHQPLPFILMVTHLAAAGIWVGGLAVLFLVALGRHDDWEVATRFSRVAFDVVVIIVATGVLQAWHELGSITALRSTRYGHLLLIKTGLVVGMLAVAALSRSVVSSRMAIRAAGAAPADSAARTMLRQRVGGELAIGIAVLAVTAALMAANPHATGASGPVSRTLVDRDVIASLTIEPARVGSNGLHLYLSGPEGSLQKFSDVTVELSDPGRGVGPAQVPLQLAGPDHYIGTLTVPFRGTWTLRASALVSEFDERVFTTQVHIT